VGNALTAFSLRWRPNVAAWYNATHKGNVIGAAWFTLGIYSFDGTDSVSVVKQLPFFTMTPGRG